MLRRLLPPLLLVASSLCALALLLELGTRVLIPEGVWRYRDVASDWQADDRIGWVMKPDLDYESSPDGPSVRFQTNEHGLISHGAGTRRTPGRARIMVFGDSMVVGRPLAREEIYTARLGAELRARGADVEVVNGGVDGYSTDQVVLLMERWIPIYQPDLVIYGATLNDFGGNSSREAYAQAKPMFVRETSGLRLVPPEGVERLRDRDRSLRRWLQYSAFYRLVQPRVRQLRARWGDWRQRNLMGLMQQVYFVPKALDDIDWDLFAALVERMDQAAQTR